MRRRCMSLVSARVLGAVVPVAPTLSTRVFTQPCTMQIALVSDSGSNRSSTTAQGLAVSVSAHGT